MNNANPTLSSEIESYRVELDNGETLAFDSVNILDSGFVSCYWTPPGESRKRNVKYPRERVERVTTARESVEEYLEQQTE